MTNKQYTALKPYEFQFQSAVKNGFVRLSMVDFKNIIAPIYNELFDEKLTTAELNCGRCRLKAIQRLGEAYFKHKPSGRPKKIDVNA